MSVNEIMSRIGVIFLLEKCCGNERFGKHIYQLLLYIFNYHSRKGYVLHSDRVRGVLNYFFFQNLRFLLTDLRKCFPLNTKSEGR
jgi:hypothetical protein